MDYLCVRKPKQALPVVAMKTVASKLASFDMAIAVLASNPNARCFGNVRGVLGTPTQGVLCGNVSSFIDRGRKETQSGKRGNVLKTNTDVGR